MIHDESLPLTSALPEEAQAIHSAAPNSAGARALRGGVPPMFAAPQPSSPADPDGGYEAG